MRTIIRIILLIVISGMLSQCKFSKPRKSVEDLKTAFNDASTVAEKYAKFKQKAMEEGFDTIARLFDAVSKSESIHAINHGKALEKLGKNDENAEIGSYEVKTTAENLQDAIKEETFEMQKTYPGFIRDAESEKVPVAAKSFSWACDGDKKHLVYFRKTVVVVVNNKETGIPFTWFICPICGNIYTDIDVKDICDFCLTKKENFIGYSESQDEK